MIETAERRQVRLLSAFLFLSVVLGVGSELIVAAVYGDVPFAAYPESVPVYIALAVLYHLSRTRHYRWAMLLTIATAAGGVFASGLSHPDAIVSGFLDYLVVTILFASLFFRLRTVAVVLAALLLSVLAVPLAAPSVSLEVILTGPITFLAGVGLLIILVAWHRDRLEQDRQAELRESEERSQRDAARAEALLRVARRLNAQLDLETLLQTICEEMTRALERPLGVVHLLDQRPGVLEPAAAIGLSLPAANSATLTRAQLLELMQARGPVVVADDLEAEADWPKREALAALGVRGLAVAVMIYEGTLIGSLTVMTQAPHQAMTEEARLLLEGLAAQAASAIMNTRVFKDARRRLEQLEALRAIDLAITGSTDLRVTLDVLLREIARQLGVDAVLVLLLEAQRGTLDYAASRGFRTPTLRYTRLRLGEGNAGRAALTRQIVAIPNIDEAPGTFNHAPAFRQEGFHAYYAAPLLAKGEVKGVLEVFHRARLDPDAEWLSFLETLAGQAALAIDNASLFQGLQRSNVELSLAYDATIVGWSHALDLRDKETEGHTQRVTELTLRLAARMNVPEAALVHMRRGALLHDIGKMGIPDAILHKPGPLSDDEWATMRRHPTYAYELLAPITYLSSALDIPYCHHEKWDGSGYPRGLRAEAIPLSARLFAVVDVYDALCSDRPYRQGWAPEAVLAHIRQGAGTHFDPRVVEAFLALMAESLDANAAPPVLGG